MAKYTMEQKYEAVRLYTVMGKEGTCYIADTPIHNIRALCSALNISSQSLYRWAETIELLDNEVNDPHDYPAETYEAFGKEPRLMNKGILVKQMEDIGYWQSLARALGLKNYRQKTSQLKLRIGTHLINSTGLVESNKEVRKELSFTVKDDFSDDLEKYERENFGRDLK